jgi:hypothetical protein
MTETRSLSLRERITPIVNETVANYWNQKISLPETLHIFAERVLKALTDAERSPSPAALDEAVVTCSCGSPDCPSRHGITLHPSPAALDLIPKAKAAIQNELPEDEPDTIPDWCYETIIKTALLAVERGTAREKDEP